MLQALAHAVDELVAIDLSAACDSEIRETLIAIIDRDLGPIADRAAGQRGAGVAAGRAGLRHTHIHRQGVAAGGDLLERGPHDLSRPPSWP
jgi:hypothetical protein